VGRDHHSPLHGCSPKLEGCERPGRRRSRAKDPKVQGKPGVNPRSYWVDEKAETILGFVEAPNPEAAARVHKEAPGLLADEIH